MPSLSHFQKRRSQLLNALEQPLLLFAGGWAPRNYPQNPYPFRADSNVLFLFEAPEPTSAALLDPADGHVTLFLPRRTPEDALWHGAVPSFSEMRDRHGVHSIEPVEELEDRVRDLVGGRPLDALAVADHRATEIARRLTGQDLDFGDTGKQGRPEVISAIAGLRMRKDDDEIAEMRRTAAITREAHLEAITRTRPGIYEQELVGMVDGCFWRHGCVPAYNTILSVRGEVLHNHSHDNLIKENDVVLLDGGAENASGYCSDVTRSWPVGGRFDAEGRDIYDIVLAAQLAAIEAVRPGARYRDLHLLACRVIADGLAGMGILRGEPDDLVASGAHALFFPHGLGHIIGLDVHDMEAFGDAVGYGPGRSRSDQFGLAALRLDVDLEPGMVVTIEPGIYFVPGILRDDALRSRFKDQVAYDKAEHFLTMHSRRGFGGIRIEDDVVCTQDGANVLTDAIPKERAVIEAMVGCAR
ncbi:MAG: aminopeptidase P family protein [Planctomycetota bacterium]